MRTNQVQYVVQFLMNVFLRGNYAFSVFFYFNIRVKTLLFFGIPTLSVLFLYKR